MYYLKQAPVNSRAYNLVSRAGYLQHWGCVVAKFKLEDGTEIEAFTAEEMEAKVNETLAGLKENQQKLMDEAKSAKQKARELEELQRQAEEEGLKQREEFRTLYEREQKAKAELAEKYESFAKRIQQKEVEGAAMSIASELTRDTKRAELLRKEVSQFARYTDDGVKFEMGGVEVDRAKIMAHITESYPFLVDGSGATGGGATGGKSYGGAVKKFNEYTGLELSAIRRENPAEYERLKREHYGT